MTDTLGINNQVNKSLEIVVMLKIMYHDTNSIKQILTLLAYGESSVMKTGLNISSHVVDGWI
jgi:hypothetical protein